MAVAAPRALEGIRVVDISMMMAGPITAMLLADLGAEVIKVEPPSGDDLRYMNSRYAPEAAPFFIAVNRNKRGIVLDLRKPEGLAVLKRLLDGADVFIHNFRPGIAEKLGVGYEQLVEAYPKLVYCSISAWGETGSWATRPGIDSLIQAMGGLMSITGEADGPALRAGVPLIDVTTPLSATIGVLAALTTRQRTGRGDKVEASLLGQGLFMQGPMFAFSAHNRMNPPRMGNRSPMAIILEAHTPTGGILLGIPTQKFWVLLCDAIGRPDLATHTDYRTHELRLKNQLALAAEVEPLLARRTREEWLAVLVKAGVPCAPINDYQQTLREEQVAAIEAFFTVEHPTAGRQLLPNSPWKLRSAKTEVRRLPPTLGRDTAEVLREFGYSPAEIAALEASGTTRGAFVEPE